MWLSGIDRIDININDSAAVRRVVEGTEDLHNIAIAPLKYVHGTTSARAMLGHLQDAGGDLLKRAAKAAREKAAERYGVAVNESSKKYYEILNDPNRNAEILQAVRDELKSELDVLATRLKDRMKDVREWLEAADVTSYEAKMANGTIASLRQVT